MTLVNAKRLHIHFLKHKMIKEAKDIEKAFPELIAKPKPEPEPEVKEVVKHGKK